MAGIDAPSLRDYIVNTPAEKRFFERVVSVSIADLNRGTSLGGRVRDLAGRSVLIATVSQLTAALAMIELDGRARRLCPTAKHGSQTFWHASRGLKNWAGSRHSSSRRAGTEDSFSADFQDASRNSFQGFVRHRKPNSPLQQ